MVSSAQQSWREVFVLFIYIVWKKDTKINKYLQKTGITATQTLFISYDIVAYAAEAQIKDIEKKSL